MIAEIIMEDEELMALALEVSKKEEELLLKVVQKIINEKFDSLKVHFEQKIQELNDL